jgi:hypothetical protein
LFRDLKNISIADLEGVNERLKECNIWREENDWKNHHSLVHGGCERRQRGRSERVNYRFLFSTKTLKDGYSSRNVL